VTDLEALFLSRSFAHIAKYPMYLSRPVGMRHPRHPAPGTCSYPLAFPSNQLYKEH
jgi:hypothetical protein